MVRLLNVIAVVLLAFSILQVGSVPNAAEGVERTSAKTRLYVRTVPPGASVTIDAYAVGTSDELLEVKPGEHVVRVEIAGRQAAERRLSATERKITRAEFVLADEAAANSATAELLAARGFSEEERKAALAAVRTSPDRQSWAGRVGGRVWAVAVRRVPKVESAQQRAEAAAVRAAGILATAAALATEAVASSQYTSAGLDDLGALCEAIAQSGDGMLVSGKVSRLTHDESARNGYAVAYVLAASKDVQADLVRPAVLRDVSRAYGNVLQGRARSRMADKKWREGLEIWLTLHAHKLATRELYLDAARCFRELGQAKDAASVVDEAVRAFGNDAPVEYLERAGDLALEIHTPLGDAAAVTAFEQAARRLGDFVTPTPTTRPDQSSR